MSTQQDVFEAQAVGDRRAAAAARPFTVTGQSFAPQHFSSLDEAQNWLTNAQPPIEDPEIKISLPKNATVPAQPTDWRYYRPGQKIVIDGGGATVNGASRGQPAAGYFLSYRPAVGPGTTQENPAPGNLEVRNLNVRGFEAGGIEVSPVVPEGDIRWNGGNNAFVSGISIHHCSFANLGSERTPYGQTDYGQQQFGVAGVLFRGVQNSTIDHCSFRHLVNGAVQGTTNGPALIHAFYCRDHSSNNAFTNNRIADVSGDPVHFANGSNDNVIKNNRAHNSGRYAFSNDWYTSYEADSVGNQVTHNTTGFLYGHPHKPARQFVDLING
ncbi:MAG: right-handed parallel beta-helix repeat-containing protein [Myxococcaceae bacterium]|nr:right-handed parallel beta-helix repeat-containing protein [Myxococcaceae bacterium]